MSINLEPSGDLEKLSDWQREVLRGFVDQTHQIVGGVHFERDCELNDAELLKLALWCTQLVGIDPFELDETFAAKFRIAIPDEFHAWLATMVRSHTEEQIQCAAGGRN